MSSSIVRISWPAAEPISLNDLKLQLGFGPVEDMERRASDILAQKLRPFISAARAAVESYLNRVLITQIFVLRMDHFPGHNLRYNWNNYPEILFPYPPFQSVQSFTYVDVSGTPQVLKQDATYGVNPPVPQYAYQLERGSETQPGRVLPAFAQPWPPTRMVPGNVLLQFRAGYGGPITCSIEEGSAVLSVTGGTQLGPAGSPFAFDPDDAPLLPFETGLPISIPGAGPTVNGVPQPLDTFVASVNGSGVATLATAASATVVNAPGWAGWPVPPEIISAIKMLAANYYDHAGDSGGGMTDPIKNLLNPYRNFLT